ncbi:sarcalumenin isoform X3 [Zootermopsis nevadensis]|uniref:sarcalumenin isoform X3 n=1 Tax=Zootermopsis nevadensis TaxID=136037 RepID=UPI000B8E3D9E|nr:sarcalumenin isoform X3 [Zootermopsis nevadensis]
MAFSGPATFRLLLFIAVGFLVSGTLQAASDDQQVPTESECRPYIEKALKQLGTSDATETTEGDSQELSGGPEVTTSDEQGDRSSTEEASAETEVASAEDSGINEEKQRSPSDVAETSAESQEVAGEDSTSAEEAGSQSVEEGGEGIREERSAEEGGPAGEASDEDTEGAKESSAAEGESAEESSAAEGESSEEGSSAEESSVAEGESVEEGASAEESSVAEGESVEEGASAEESSAAEGEKSTEEGSDSSPSTEDTTTGGEGVLSPEEGPVADEGASAESSEDATSAKEGEATSAEEGASGSSEEESATGDAIGVKDATGGGAASDEEPSAEETEKESSEETEKGPLAEPTAEESPKASPGGEEVSVESGEEQQLAGEAAPSAEEGQSAEGGDSAEGGEATPPESIPEQEELTLEVEIPENLRPRDHVAQILRLDPESIEKEMVLAKTVDATLKELKRVYDNAIKPLEILFKYRELSNRHFGDPEIFSKPLILFMGPWSGGKSTIINYLLDNEYTPTALRTGAEPSPAYFNILMWGDQLEILDGTQLAADWTFSGLQKFGQGMLDRLRGLRLPNRLLEKVNIVEIPGILEIRKQVERLFPFNDACQWFIDRADIIFLVYDPSKLDVGPETEAILDQLKGREYQTRIILNKADQVRPEELMRVQGTLIWNISPLMSSSEPPVMYSASLWSLPYEVGAPTRLLHAQERAFLRDLRDAIDKRVENKIASARRFAVRVRNHAKMVDCYLTTYYNHKSFFGNKKKISDDIIEHPQDYHIYEGLSTLTNISRYDLPDPDVYKDFFRLNPLYDFQLLSSTCTYFRGCPINRLDISIAYDLPELVGKYKKSVDAALAHIQPKS